MNARKSITIGRVKGSMIYSGVDYTNIENPLVGDLYLHSTEYAFYQYQKTEDDTFEWVPVVTLDVFDNRISAVETNKVNKTGDELSGMYVFKENPESIDKTTIDPYGVSVVFDGQRIDIGENDGGLLSVQTPQVDTNRIQTINNDEVFEIFDRATGVSFKIYFGDFYVAIADGNGNETNFATNKYVNEKIADLINGAPETLDTLFEIANALQDDDNAISGLITEISKKAYKTEIPTKLSQLEQDITVGGGVSEDKVNEIVDAKIADLVNSAPETLDTLGEVAQAIQENDSVVEALNSAIGNKANKDEVMEIIENNSETTEELEVVEAETFDIALSSSYDMESDNEVPTSKAVMSMIENAITRVLNEEV